MKRLEVDNSWTLFLDRDGVINYRNFEGYITDVNDFIFLPNVLDAIAKLSQIFGRIIVVTNQQGVGKKIMSKSNLEEIHRYMIDEINRHGGKIDAIFVATNLKGAKTDRRKPNSDMALEAQQKFPAIDFKKSMMVGDTESDIKFGINLGMKTTLIRSKEKVSIEPDFSLNSLNNLIPFL